MIARRHRFRLGRSAQQEANAEQSEEQNCRNTTHAGKLRQSSSDNLTGISIPDSPLTNNVHWTPSVCNALPELQPGVVLGRGEFRFCSQERRQQLKKSVELTIGHER